MAVITISRGSFSGGRRLAEAAAARLGYRCLDRDTLVARIAAHGVSPAGLRAALEQPPTVWDRFRHTKYVYLSLVRAALAETALEGNVVYHGNAGHLLLQGVSHVMRARVIAPLSSRVAAIRQSQECSEEAAVNQIRKIDQESHQWARALYGIDWSDASLYDLVLNLEHLTVDQACEIIAATARQDAFRETAASRSALRDLAVASRVQAQLAVTPETLHLEVEVVARDGAIVVRGAWSAAAESDRVLAIAGQVPGVQSVGVEIVAG